MSVLQDTQALTRAITEEMQNDKNVFIIGEDIENCVFGYPFGAVQQFGNKRVRNTPISEAGFVGLAAGAAMMGLRPITDWTLSPFAYPAMDQIVNNVAKATSVYGGKYKLPMVMLSLTIYNIGNGSSHSDRPHPMFMNVPGLKIVASSSAYDTYGLMKSAIRDDDPVLFYRDPFIPEGEVPDEEYFIPLGEAAVKKEGSDVTIVAIQDMVRIALAAAEKLEKEGIHCEVIDPRTIKPLDTETIFASIKKTGKLVCVDAAHKTCSAGSEIAALAVTECFEDLKAPVQIVATPDINPPATRALEALPYYHPTEDAVIAAVKKII